MSTLFRLGVPPLEQTIVGSPWLQRELTVREVSHPAWAGMAASSLPTDLMDLAICTLHRNGYVREAALRKLITQQDGRWLAPCLLRLSDWVPSIRDLARAQVLRYCQPQFRSYWNDQAHLLVQVLNRPRTQIDAPWAEPVLVFLVDDLQPILGLHPLHWPAVRKLLRRLGPRVPLELMLASADFLVRRMALVRCSPEQKALMRKDPSPAVRAEVVTSDDYRWGLLDRSERVRSRASHALKQVGEEPRLFYLDHLEDSPSIALAGLRAWGNREDVPAILPYVCHASPGLRRAAVRALARIDAKSLPAGKLLEDPAPGVVREYLRVADLSTDHLRDLSRRPELRKVCLQRLLKRGRWEALLTLLILELPIDNWLRKHGATATWAPPSSQQREKLLELLPEKIVRQLGI